MSSQVRDRNESAWLLPNDGTRANHRLRRRHAAVRRHRRDRPGHRGLRGGRLGHAGSVLPTQGSANPALTIMAVAARAAGLLQAGARGGPS